MVVAPQDSTALRPGGAIAAGAAVEAACPVLVFGSGHRCGSTLIQRLLTSHPSMLIWGEHGGHVCEILRASAKLRHFDDMTGEPARGQFEEASHQGWIA